MILVDQLSADFTLGLDFHKDQCCIIDIASRVLSVGARQLRLPLVTGDQILVTPSPPVPVALVETVQVPPMAEMEVRGEVTQPVSGTWVVERVPLKASVVVARAVVIPTGGQGVCMRVINPTPDTVTIYKGTKLATLEPVDDVSTVMTVATEQGPTEGCTDDHLREITRQCHVSVSDAEREQLFELLTCYRDIFATSSSDLGRTTKVQHKINTGDHPPIRQPVRRVPAAHREQVREGIQEMLQKGIVRSSSRPWASLLVLL